MRWFWNSYDRQVFYKWPNIWFTSYTGQAGSNRSLKKCRHAECSSLGMSDKFTSLTPSWKKAIQLTTASRFRFGLFTFHNTQELSKSSTAQQEQGVFKLANATHTHSTETLVFPITSSFQLTTEPIWRTRPNQKIVERSGWSPPPPIVPDRRYIAVVVWKRVFQNNVQIRVFPALFEQTEQYCRIRKAFGSLRYEINIFSSLNITKIDFKTA